MKMDIDSSSENNLIASQQQYGNQYAVDLSSPPPATIANGIGNNNNSLSQSAVHRQSVIKNGGGSTMRKTKESHHSQSAQSINSSPQRISGMNRFCFFYISILYFSLFFSRKVQHFLTVKISYRKSIRKKVGFLLLLFEWPNCSEDFRWIWIVLVEF